MYQGQSGGRPVSAGRENHRRLVIAGLPRHGQKSKPADDAPVEHHRPVPLGDHVRQFGEVLRAPRRHAVGKLGQARLARQRRRRGQRLRALVASMTVVALVASVLLVMTVHSVAEGVAIGTAFAGGTTLAVVITAAIAVHNIPEGLAISAVMRPKGSSIAAWMCLARLRMWLA